MAGKDELTDTLGCTNLSWCTEGLQAMADLSSGATFAKCGWAGCLRPQGPVQRAKLRPKRSLPCRPANWVLLSLFKIIWGGGEETLNILEIFAHF